MTTPSTEAMPAPVEKILDTHKTGCCVVGGGPAGAVLSLLLARQGIDVTLLESHNDFDREFRGDTFHASSMENMAEIGLADELLKLCHSHLHKFLFTTKEGPRIMADFSLLKSAYPYVAMIPQVKFLNFITDHAGRYPNFHLRMGCSAQELIVEEGVVRGVRYRGADGLHDLRALVTIGADGRGSRLRTAAKMTMVKTAPPMDVLWFRLTRRPEDPSETNISLRINQGRLLILIDREQYWQAGFVIAKGSFKEVRAEGIEALRKAAASLAPQFAERLEELKAWPQVALLTVESGRLEKWHQPGLLLIGDAAHVMSPVGGVGINYAIQDAVATANQLTEPLRAGAVDEFHLEAIQRRREWPTKVIQKFQGMIQKRIVAQALAGGADFQMPLPTRIISAIPFLRGLPARMISYGVRPEHVRYRDVRA